RTQLGHRDLFVPAHVDSAQKRDEGRHAAILHVSRRLRKSLSIHDPLRYESPKGRNAMPELVKDPTLADLQRYVAELEQERGFAEQDVLKKCLLLGEEIGELFKSIRKREGISIDLASKASTADEELADVLIMICSIANRLGVDLEEAFRRKEEVNKRRTW